MNARCSFLLIFSYCENKLAQTSFVTMKLNRKITSSEEKYCKINSLKLIHLVRAQEIIYNSEAEGYMDKNLKDVAWERVYRSLFPRYETLSTNIKDLIATNVRRRWKTLRDAIGREIKKNGTVENYVRKKGSPLFAELEFLIPHIRSTHCAKLADALGLRDRYSNVNETDEQEYDEDYNDTVDLTEEQQDIKPFILKPDPTTNDLDSNGLRTQSACYPNLHIDTSEDGSSNYVAVAASANQIPQSSSSNENLRGEYCSIVQCKEGEFMSSTLLCTKPGSEENYDDPKTVANQQQRQTKLPSPNVSAKKRPRQSGNDFDGDSFTNGEPTNGGESSEIHNKILRCLTSLDRRENREHDSEDEDRMFLLSLVSDLKRVPSAKKMLLKAEIAMAIARAIPS